MAVAATAAKSLFSRARHHSTSRDTCSTALRDRICSTASIAIRSPCVAWRRMIAMLTRLLTNLKGAYLRASEDQLALAAVDRLLVLHPDDLDELRDRGLLLYRIGRYHAALGCLGHYLEEAPDARDRATIERHITALRQLVVSLN